MLLKIENLEKSYLNETVIRELDLYLNEGEILCILGESGCGKSTLLRCISGFEEIQKGKILFQDELLSSPEFRKPPADRNIGFVFQNYALFPHLTAFENVCFGLHQLPKKLSEQKANEYIELVGLDLFVNKYPHQLSGGQQQRLALARALAPEPKLLLLDEPFSNLDKELSHRLSLELRQILKKCGVSAILVTHNQEEAFDIADRIGILHNHQMLQCSDTYDIYHQPLNEYIANFIGRGFFIDVKAISETEIEFSGQILKAKKQERFKKHKEYKLLLRPEDIVHDDESPLKAKVIDRLFRGAYYLYEIEYQQQYKLLTFIMSHQCHNIGEEIGFRFEVEHLIAFEKDSDESTK